MDETIDMSGSLLPAVARRAAHSQGALFWEHEGYRNVREEKWKLVSGFR